MFRTDLWLLYQRCVMFIQISWQCCFLIMCCYLGFITFLYPACSVCTQHCSLVLRAVQGKMLAVVILDSAHTVVFWCQLKTVFKCSHGSRESTQRCFRSDWLSFFNTLQLTLHFSAHTLSYFSLSGVAFSNQRQKQTCEYISNQSLNQYHMMMF